MSVDVYIGVLIVNLYVCMYADMYYFTVGESLRK